MDFNKWNPFWASSYSVMAFLIIVGNSLTIATLLNKKFRKRPHFLLTSLAFADLFVGFATILALLLYSIFFYHSSALTFAFNVSDMFSGLCSVFHLAVISLERLHATLRPFRHRQLSFKAYWVAIATPWILSLSVRISTLFGQTTKRTMLCIIIIFLITPLLTTCFSYLVIWRSRKKRISTVRSFRQNQEARFSRTIFLVTAASFITWIPFLCVCITVRVSPVPIPGSAVFFIKLLQYCNSFVNFVIYILRFPSYRKALFSLCRFHCFL
ncbi:adenosine receptor A3-like [Acropora millepora]|uniref:adenosine receptor A3-like n=1 Tax=Acropora millepora TaxID=45264 RepID=UPI001CF11095|nr:adenosine receptor A3-like [Acropora millepora]XP_044163116.1 adenosine receptor A3-like [Acropora millepora]